MSENKKSFWSSIPGLVTGLAGLLTGIVGLVTVLIQLDVIGGDDDGTPNASVTTTVVPGGTANTSGGAGGGAITTISGRLAAEPTTLKLATGEREKTLTVRNASNASVTVLKPEYKGRDSSAFTVDSGCTNVNLRAGASCTVKIQLAPSGPLKTYEASLVLEAKEISQVTEVPVTASTLL